MNHNKKSALVGAAIAGLVGFGTTMTAAPQAQADDGGKGHCMGSNGCKGKSECGVEGGHGCHAQNACKGKGFLVTTKAECDKMMKKNKAIKFVVPGGAKHEEKKPGA